MISVLVVLLCGLVILIGVIFLIYGLSQKDTSNTERQAAAIVQTTRISDGDRHFSTTTSVSGAYEGSMGMGDDKISIGNPHYVWQKILEVQDSPNLVVAIIKTVEAQVNSSLHLSLVEKMKKYYDAYAGGWESQSKALVAKMEVDQLLRQYKDPELQTLKTDRTRLTVEADNAELRKRIREANGDEGKGKNQEGRTSEYKRNLEERNEKDRIKREKDFERDQDRFRSDSEEARAYKKLLEEEMIKTEQAFVEMWGPMRKWTPEQFNKYNDEVIDLEERIKSQRARNY